MGGLLGPASTILAHHLPFHLRDRDLGLGAPLLWAAPQFSLVKEPQAEAYGVPGPVQWLGGGGGCDF